MPRCEPRAQFGLEIRGGGRRLERGHVLAGRRAGVVITGGNVDPGRLPWVNKGA